MYSWISSAGNTMDATFIFRLRHNMHLADTPYARATEPGISASWYQTNLKASGIQTKRRTIYAVTMVRPTI